MAVAVKIVEMENPMDNSSTSSAQNTMKLKLLSKQMTKHKKSKSESVINDENLLNNKLQMLETVKKAPLLVFALDRNGIITSIEGGGLDKLGMKSDDCVGKFIFKIFDGIIDKKHLDDILAGKLSKSITRINDLSFEIYYSQLRDKNNEVIGILGAAINISEYKNTEDELNSTLKSLNDFKHIVMKSPAVVFRWRFTEKWPYEWPLDYISENIIQFGYTADDLYLGNISWADITHPEDTKRLEDEIIDYAKRNITDFSQKYRIVTKSGETRWIEDQTTIIKDSNGVITHFQGILFDVTERKQAEKALREKEKRIRAQFKGIPVPTYSWKKVDDDFELIDYNDAAMEITRNEIKKMIGVKAKDLYRDKPEILKDLWQCFNKKTIINKEMLYQYQTTGESKYLSVRYAYVPTDLVIVHTEDITEINQIEIRNKVRLEFLENLRSAGNINECLKYSCMAIYEAKLFKQAILILINDENEVANLGQIGLDDNVIQSIKSDFMNDVELLKKKEQRKYRISNSYFVPEEANIYSKKIRKSTKIPPESLDNNSLWKTSDRLIIPIVGSSNQYEGFLSVDLPFNDKRPVLYIVVYLEGIIDIVMKKVHELKIFEKLQIERQMLQEKNIALKEILSHIEEEKLEFKAQIARDIDKTIMPAFTKLINNDRTVNYNCYNFIMNCFEKLVSSSGGMLYSYSKLSVREKEICAMIMNGAASKEIASDLGIALSTVCKYREKIRKKLGLTNTNKNLTTALKNL